MGTVLFHGALTQTARERVMTAMAPGYSVAKWLDVVLPSNAVLLVFEELRYRALLPRPFVVGDQFFIVVGNQNSIVDVFDWKRRLIEFVREKQATVLVARYPMRERRLQLVGNPRHSACWTCEVPRCGSESAQ